MKEKISIIVPVFRVEKYLRKCVDSILAQTYQNIEIILVNDGSDDNCPAICDEYASKHGNIKVFHKQNGGLMRAWIDGVGVSTGDYIGFVDSDDFIHKEMFKVLMDNLKEYDSDISVCGFSLVKQDDSKIRDYDWGENIYTVGENIENCLNLLLDSKHNLAPARWNKLYKRQLVLGAIEKVDTDISFGEDLNFNLYTFSAASKVVTNTEHLYNYLFREESLVNQTVIKLLPDEIRIINYITRDFAEKLDKQMLCNYIISKRVLPFIIKLLDGKNYKLAKEFYRDKNIQYWLKSKEAKGLPKRDKIAIKLLKLKMFRMLRFLNNIRTRGRKNDT